MVCAKKRALKLALACAAVLLLGGCGGGGGSSTPSSPPLPPTPRTVPLEFAYFGVSRREEIAEWADHCTLVYLMDWPAFTDNVWDTAEGHAAIADEIIARLQEAKRRGVHKAIVACGFATFGPKYDYRGNGELQRFRQRVSDAGLLEMVVGISLVDEPDMRDKGISDATMMTAFREARSAWPEAAITVIFGDGGSFPGLAEADLVGRDQYDLGTGVLARLPALQGAQQYIEIVGGASPWKTPPEPFLAFGEAHGEVWGIVAFRWFDHPSGAGIRSNGMAPAYRAVGQKIQSTLLPTGGRSS